MRVADYANGRGNGSRGEGGGAARASNGGVRISAVVEETGISKELIHHYIRQGLLPKSKSRALYSHRQVRLLHQIRLLREDHHLPLEVIRQLFSVFDFDPARIESLTLGESLSKRVTEFASRGDLLSSETVSADELCAATGVSADRLTEYAQAHIVSPIQEAGKERFTVYDARAVALCENGVALGIPFDSFRTIASYVRIAFELEHPGFYEVVRDPSLDQERALADVFIRWEISGSFVQNVLSALTQRRLRTFLEGTQVRKPALDDVVYRPSAAFVRRHGLEDQIDAARERLGQRPEHTERWLHVARLMRHTGRFVEAAFFLEESIEKWPEDTTLRSALGCARALLGDLERALDELGGAVEANAEDPAASVFLALVLFKRAAADGRPEALIRDGARIMDLIDAALAHAGSAADAAAAAEVRMLAGWLLASMPPSFHSCERGIEVLADTLRELEQGLEVDGSVPGLHERALINAAYLLFDRLRRNPPSFETAATDRAAVDLPRADYLSALICRLDPGSKFAEAAFLSTTESMTPGRQNP